MRGFQWGMGTWRRDCTTAALDFSRLHSPPRSGDAVIGAPVSRPDWPSGPASGAPTRVDFVRRMSRDFLPWGIWGGMSWDISPDARKAWPCQAWGFSMQRSGECAFLAGVFPDVFPWDGDGDASLGRKWRFRETVGGPKDRSDVGARTRSLSSYESAW